MQGYSRRVHEMIRLTDEDDALRRNYLRIQSFKNIISGSRTLTLPQKSALYNRAKAGDLDGAEAEYRKLTCVREIEPNEMG